MQSRYLHEDVRYVFVDVGQPSWQTVTAEQQDGAEQMVTLTYAANPNDAEEKNRAV